MYSDSNSRLGCRYSYRSFISFYTDTSQQPQRLRCSSCDGPAWASRVPPLGVSFCSPLCRLLPQDVATPRDICFGLRSWFPLRAFVSACESTSDELTRPVQVRMVPARLRKVFNQKVIRFTDSPDLSTTHTKSVKKVGPTRGSQQYILVGFSWY